MKRCPQCEFTFDDHQEFCDFDGTELTVLAELTPSLKNVSLLRAEAPSLFGRVVRSRVTLAGLSLAVVVLSALMVGYFDAANSPELVRRATRYAEKKFRHISRLKVPPMPAWSGA